MSRGGPLESGGSLPPDSSMLSIRMATIGIWYVYSLTGIPKCLQMLTASVYKTKNDREIDS